MPFRLRGGRLFLWAGLKHWRFLRLCASSGSIFRETGGRVRAVPRPSRHRPLRRVKGPPAPCGCRAAPCPPEAFAHDRLFFIARRHGPARGVRDMGIHGAWRGYGVHGQVLFAAEPRRHARLCGGRDDRGFLLVAARARAGDDRAPWASGLRAGGARLPCRGRSPAVDGHHPAAYPSHGERA